MFAPLQWLGNSHHHMDFPGTLSAEPRVYLDLLCVLAGDFIAHGFTRLLLLNGHGGNDVPGSRPCLKCGNAIASAAIFLLLLATYWNLASDANQAHPDLQQSLMGHACEWETSMMLCIAPQLVKDHQSVLPQEFGIGFEPATRGWTMPDRSQPGHIGFPHEASAEKGEALFQLSRRAP